MSTMAGAVRCCTLRLAQSQSSCIHLRSLYISSVLRTAEPETSSEGSAPPIAAGGKKKITLPKKKKRDELSILRALASTVKKDFTGPHMKFVDDPQLIPTTAQRQRAWSLSKASGQKSARYVFETYPQNFLENFAEPNIPDWMPDFGPQQPEDTELGLQERINRKQVLESWNSYQRNRESGVPVSEDTLNDLLDLLCVYNSENALSDPNPMENYVVWEKGPDQRSKNIMKTWKDQGFAEELFKEMGNKNARAYCSMIKGRAKYFQVDNALQLFEEAKQNNIPLNVPTYNAVLGVITFMDNDSLKVWNLVKDIMAEMAQKGVQPDVTTFNNALYALSKQYHEYFGPTRKWAMELVNEMKECGLEPSLTTYYHLITIFYKGNKSESNLLNDIITNLEGKALTISHPDDYKFFSSAMAKCVHNVKDIELAHKINDLLNCGNHQCIGNSREEGLYYTMFVKMLCLFEPIDRIMEHWEHITPHVFIPTFTGMNEIIRAVELNEAYKYIPKLWTDMTLFMYETKYDLVEQLTSVMAKEKQSPELQETYMKIVQAIQDKVEQHSKSKYLKNPFRLTGPLISDLSIVSLNAGDFDKAWDLFEYYCAHKRTVERFPSDKALDAIAKEVIDMKDTDKAMQVLEVISDLAYPSLYPLAQRAQNELELTDSQRDFLNDLL